MTSKHKWVIPRLNFRCNQYLRFLHMHTSTIRLEERRCITGLERNLVVKASMHQFSINKAGLTTQW
jgi:hypothetical protein